MSDFYNEFFAEAEDTNTYVGQLQNQERRRRNTRKQNEHNEVGVCPPLPPEVIEARAHYEENYVDAHQDLFKRTTGLKPFGQDQKDSIKHSQFILNNGGHLLKLEPRGFTKTTRTANECTMAVLQGKIRFGLILANSVQKANDILDTIKTSLIENEELARLYPATIAAFRHLEERPQKARFQTYDGMQTYIAFNIDHIRFPIIPGETSSGSVIKVRSMDNVRGLFVSVKAGPLAGTVLRPDFAFLDDIQTDEQAQSPTSVDKIVHTINNSILLSGTHANPISAIMNLTPICEGCVASHYRHNEPEWELRQYKMLKEFPERMDLWEGQYRDILTAFDREIPGDKIRAGLEARKFLEENYEEMHRGAVASWEWCYAYNKRPQLEISAVQHAMNYKLLKPLTFESECQVRTDYREEINEEIQAKPELILSRISHTARRTTHKHHRHIVTHIDIHKHILTYVTLSSPENQFEGQIIDVGTFPDQPGAWKKHKIARPLHTQYPHISRELPEDIVEQGLLDLIDHLATSTYRREDGVELTHSIIGIDSQFYTETVHKVCRMSVFKSLLVPCVGVGIEEKDLGIAERRYTKDCEKHYHCVDIPTPDRTLTALHIDTNYMKSAVHKGFIRDSGPGTIRLYEPSWVGEHTLYANHLNEEHPEVRENPKTKRRLIVWRTSSHQPNNDHFDNTSGCIALLSKLGVPFAVQASRPRPRLDMANYIEKQKSSM